MQWAAYLLVVTPFITPFFKMSPRIKLYLLQGDGHLGHSQVVRFSTSSSK